LGEPEQLGHVLALGFFNRLIHLENRKKRTDQPSAERVLKAFSKVTLTIMKDREGRELGHWLTPLSTLQQDILHHLGLQSSLYSQLEIHNTQQFFSQV
jgi:hypothetical protein